jgi:hypothetical protein
MTTEILAVPGAKMIYLIKRRESTSREELIAHWFANHMPIVIQGQADAAASGKRHASRYIATLFEANKKGIHPVDGMAQLWWDAPLRMPTVPHGLTPTDTFQEKAEPYVPWATTEYVVIDGELSVAPLTLNAPFPSTRSGFYKKSFLVPAKAGVDYDKFFEHWLNVHAPNVRGVMEQVGGFRYCVSLSINPESEPYAGLAELYFPDESNWDDYRRTIAPDGMEEFVENEGLLILGAGTEMIGIP